MNSKHKGVETLSYQFLMSDGLPATGVLLRSVTCPADAPTTIVLHDKGNGEAASLVSDRVNRGEQVLAADLLFTGDSWKGPDAPLYVEILHGLGDRALGMRVAQLHALTGWVRKLSAGGQVRIEAAGPRSQVSALVAAALQPELYSVVSISDGIPSLGYLLAKPVASVLEVPSLEIVAPPDWEPLDAALAALETYDWVVRTSANAVSALLRRIAVLGLEPRLRTRGAQVACVGPATSAALRASFPADSVALAPASGFGADALDAAFSERGVRGARVLFPSSTRAREAVPRGRRALGAEVDVVAAYATVEPAGLPESVARCLDEGFDLALFASPSAVDGFARAAGERSQGLPAAVIGPTTEAAARAAGLQRARIDGHAVGLADRMALDPRRAHRVDVLVDRLARATTTAP